MQQGRPTHAQSLLRRCAVDQVARLGGAGEEGGKRSIENIVSLRMVADTKEVARALELHGGAAAAAAVVRVTGAAAPPPYRRNASVISLRLLVASLRSSSP